MRIITIHNRYQISGGEDAVFAMECELLRAHGHDVITLCETNDGIADAWLGLGVAVSSVYSRSWRRKVSSAIATHRPDVIHVHNFFPLISPAVYFAAHDCGVPVVQTLHNYRLICPNALLLREGTPCELCVGKAFAWPAIVHACYRGSRPASAAVATMLATHSALGGWREMVEAYIALTDFARLKMISGGLPAAKVVVKPGFVQDPGMGSGSGSYALFVGRISLEKGVRVMLQAWRKLGSIPLKIVGEGPIRHDLMREFVGLKGVEWLGAAPPAEVGRLMADARALIFPSIWYEGMPLVILEAFAAGTPVIASDLGAMSSMVEHGVTGLHFISGQPDDLAVNVERMWQDRDAWWEMRRQARAVYEARYTAERNYEGLIAIYNRCKGAGAGNESSPAGLALR